jgi:hypothetical protein|tara:strand:- start:1388 stop:1615 length:228 start_codon:yes stop_codon:yes gene_type:complete
MTLKVDEIKKDFISEAIKKRIEECAEVELREARKRLIRKTPEIVAGIVVDIMGMSSFEEFKDKFIFTIKKEKDES